MSVQFDDSAADRLISIIREVATLLRNQASGRRRAANDAMDDFSGAYAKRFEEGCRADSEGRARLAELLENLATQIERAKQLADEEKRRINDLAAWRCRMEELNRAWFSGYDFRSGERPQPSSWLSLEAVKPSEVPITPPTIAADFSVRERERVLVKQRSKKSSADPNRLRSCARTLSGLNAGLAERNRPLAGAWNTFVTSCSWVRVFGSSFLSGSQCLFSESEADVVWLGRIADAFDQAGGGKLTNLEVTLAIIEDDVRALRDLLFDPTLSPEEVAKTWGVLSETPGFDLDALIEKYSFELACLNGLPFRVMSEAGVYALNWTLEISDKRRVWEAYRRMGFTEDERQIESFWLDLIAIQTALEDARDMVPEDDVVQLVSFGRHDGAVSAGISMGDLDAAKTVGVFVPGMLADARSISDPFEAFQSIRDEDTSIALVSWYGYNSPNIAEEGLQGRAEAGGDACAAFFDAIAAQRADHPVERLVGIAHSYGTNVLAEAMKRTDAEVDVYVALGSAGLQAGTTADDLGVREIYATLASGDPIADGPGRHINVTWVSGEGGISIAPRVDPRKLEGAHEFSSEETEGGKAVTMHNLVTPMNLPERMQNYDGIPASEEVGYLDRDSSAVSGLYEIVWGTWTGE